MKLRVLSDLHVDINNRYMPNRSLRLEGDVFTLIAGDTADSPKKAIDWIQKNIQNGLVIAGNHIVYSGDKRALQDLKLQLAQAFPPDSPITFLDHMTGVMHKEVDNILFIGTTLYTDYSLLPDVSVREAMLHSCRRSGLMDFRTGYTQDQGRLRHITPLDYSRWFTESLQEITRLVEANPQKEIVLLTHHCPSARCCSDYYGILNAAFASNLEPFITAHPNIKLWVAGHTHHRKNFKIGNCLVLLNPRGYEHIGQGLGFNPNTFVDTSDWSVRQSPLKTNPKEDKAVMDELLKQACLTL
ncbi:MAG: metallophosphoesterase [Alphaproteobacteria bacterium]|nr:metallophosphoesterase [Alphaproteobacteria bacterium]